MDEVLTARTRELRDRLFDLTLPARANTTGQTRTFRLTVFPRLLYQTLTLPARRLLFARPTIRRAATHPTRREDVLCEILGRFPRMATATLANLLPVPIVTAAQPVDRDNVETERRIERYHTFDVDPVLFRPLAIHANGHNSPSPAGFAG